MYNATITKLTNIRQHPNADRLKLATCIGEQVVIGLDHQEGELGIYFPCDGQLSSEFCYNNNLFSNPEFNKNQNVKGYFANNRRVRAQRFRGEKSNGIWLPLDSLSFTGYDLVQLEENVDLVGLNGHVFCQKYITEATKNISRQQKTANLRHEITMFKMHFETAKFKQYVDTINIGDLIVISEKIHSTSQRVGYVLDNQPNWLDKIFNLFGFYRQNWTKLIGTRKVILCGGELDSYYKDAFRYKAVEKALPNLYKGEVLYGEVCAWLSHDTCVQKCGKINFSYGVSKDQPKMFVYRIVRTNEDGKEIELSWNQVKSRCGELGLDYVPEMCDPFIYNGNKEELIELVDSLTDGQSTLDTHIREGVCIRVEGKDFHIYKNKSFAFLEMEDKAKDDETVINIDEV